MKINGNSVATLELMTEYYFIHVNFIFILFFVINLSMFIRCTVDTMSLVEGATILALGAG